MDDMDAALETQPEQLLVDDPKIRAAQRNRLGQLCDELVAEGADGTKHMRELESRVATWPE